jgi:hypothetical protein
LYCWRAGTGEARRGATEWYNELFAVDVNVLWLHEELWSGRPDHRAYMMQQVAITDAFSHLKGQEQQVNKAVLKRRKML